MRFSVVIPELVEERTVGPLLRADSGVPTEIHASGVMSERNHKYKLGGSSIRDVSAKELRYYNPLREQRERDEDDG